MMGEAEGEGERGEGWVSARATCALGISHHSRPNRSCRQPSPQRHPALPHLVSSVHDGLGLDQHNHGRTVTGDGGTDKVQRAQCAERLSALSTPVTRPHHQARPLPHPASTLTASE